MGSGKSGVGARLARELGWAFLDFDEEIVLREGLPIPEIFRQHGEEHFREVEEVVGEDLLRLERVVLASGGGWPARPGRMESLPGGTLSVWLKVSAPEAVRRARSEGTGRPLLEVDDPLARAETLLKEREGYYEKAHADVDTSGLGVEDVTRRIVNIMNQKGR